MNDAVNDAELIAEMFKAYVSKRQLQATQIPDLVRAMSRAISQPGCCNGSIRIITSAAEAACRSN
jgi:predicted transcriptional regulator